MLSNNERTPQVIRNAMLKFCIDDDPENYTLSQVLANKGLQKTKSHVLKFFNLIFFIMCAFRDDFTNDSQCILCSEHRI